MAYKRLNLNPNLPRCVLQVIRQGVEPMLEDVHWLLVTAIPVREQRQFQLPVAHVLFGVVSGVSTQLYSGEGTPGSRFKEFLLDFFPFDVDRPDGVSERDTVSELWDIFRSPLVHYLGMDHRLKFKVKYGATLRGSDEAERQVENLELSETRVASDPFYVASPSRRVLWVDRFYWGVRKSIER